MRIDQFQNVPSVLQTFKTEKSPNLHSTEDKKPDTSVSLSSFGEVLQSLQRQSVQSSDVRAGRVEDLKNQVQSPNFKIDHSHLASQLIDSNIIDSSL